MLALALAVGTALPAYSDDLVYSFSYTAQVGTAQSFGFSLVSPTFIGPGMPAFQPFEIIDRSTVFTISQDLVGISTGVVFGSTFVPPGDGCFTFAT